MVNTLCIIQARLTSTRLPNKILMPLGNNGLTLLEHVYLRLKQAQCIDEVVFAIPGTEENEPLKIFLQGKHIPFYVEYGDENNVLLRFYNCAQLYKPKYVFRATCDNPFVDWKCADLLFEHRDEFDYQYSHSAPLGTAIELLTMDALEEAYKKGATVPELEHVTQYIIDRPEKFRVGDTPYYVNVPFYRLTVDTKEDYQLASIVYKELDKGESFTNEQVYEYLASHPEVASINANIIQKIV